MRDRINCILFAIVFNIFLFPLNVMGQLDFSSLNLALKYNPASSVPFHYQVTLKEDTFVVFFSFELPDPVNFNDQYTLLYEIKDEYGSKNSLMTRTVNYPRSGIGEDGRIKYFRIEIKDDEGLNILFLRLKNNLSGLEYVWDILLKGPLTYDAPDFYILKAGNQLPYLSPYLNMGERLQIENTNSASGTYYIYHYDQIFSAADPPMYRLDKDVSRSMKVDTIFSIKSDELFSLPKYGLYFIQSDTTSYSGISIRSEERFFPKLVRMEDIIDPVIYLTTRQEIERLKKDENQKEAFEKFWLNLSASEDQASRMISEYFNQVEIANRIYTNYKEGWKTDMGMIYIIFGPPDEVTRNGETETWYYPKQTNASAIVFNFLRLKSIFTNQHFLLIRDRQYKNPWFKEIDDWRRGRVYR